MDSVKFKSSETANRRVPSLGECGHMSPGADIGLGIRRRHGP